jgi:penicillin-binding protein 1A
VLFLGGLLIFLAVAGGLYLLSRVPLPPLPAQSQTTFIYDANGRQLAALDSGQNRVVVPLDQVPQVVIDAILSTEDHNFYRHGAVDPLGIIRAAIADLRRQGNLQGASTITQQYVKLVYVGSGRTLANKLKEAALAIKLQRKLSKDQILERYLNTVYFGRGAYGVEAASQAYFGRDVTGLDLSEASFLAGLIRSPETDDPYRGYADTATARRLLTLKAMVRDRKIDESQLEQVNAIPITASVRPPAATELRVADGQHGTQYFVDYVRQQLIQRLGRDRVLGGGLRVTTTLEPTMQDQAWDSVYGSPGGLQPYRAANPEPSGALVAIDGNGQVKALVGGEDFSRSQVDLALGTAGGGTGRQPGSTFKPFLLAETLREGYTVQSRFPAPSKIIINGGASGARGYEVDNFNDEDFGPGLSLVDATADSVNTVYAQLEMSIGPPRLVDMATQLGLNPAELAPDPSLVLGTVQVSVLEMAAAYNTFADGGTYVPPRVITRVTTSDGSVVPWNDPPPRQVLTRAQAAVVTFCLQQVVLRGTGTAAALLRQPIAGKTGTTSSYTDAWFIGYTPHLTTAVWMGYPSGSRPMTNGLVRGIQPGVEGGSIPAEMFSRFMAQAIDDGPYTGSFDPVYRLPGTIVPLPSSVSYPLGTGSTTTVEPPSTASTTSTTGPKTTTTGTTTSVPSTAPPATPPGSVRHPTPSVSPTSPSSGPGPLTTPATRSPPSA